ncbi:hypothetical protein ACFONN_13685 [Dyella humi]|uniref:Uncharacterized protein n=1 Tax=Dyella humi TaxID=1770547 RepID=A0ABW8ILG6_9GAMM
MRKILLLILVVLPLAATPAEPTTTTPVVIAPPTQSTTTAPAPTLSSGQTVDYDNYGILLYGTDFDANTYVDIRSTTGSNILLSVSPPNITYLPGSVTGALSFRINDPTLQSLLATQGLRFYVVSPTAGNQFAGPVTITRGSPSSSSQPAVFHSIYFHEFLGSFWAQLADDAGSPSPRQQMVWSINNEMQTMRASGIDTITVALPDNDGWQSQHGGGFSYDPINYPSPQYAAAQEILLRIAAANDLKVIFVIATSPYRESTDGRASWNGLADQYDVTPATDGALNFIHSLIDPAAIYGNVMTTELSTIGLTDGPIGSYYKDPRVLGFILAPEFNPIVKTSPGGVETHQVFFNKYWNWFYNLVHWNGSTTAFAGLYLIGSPVSPGTSAEIPIIKNFKSWFAPGSGYTMPDLIGIEGYGGAGYPLQNAAADMNVLLDAVIHADTKNYPGDYAIPSQKIFIGEANTDELSNPYTNQYYDYMQQLLSRRVLAGTQWFASDSLTDGTPPTLGDSGYDLFQVSFTASGTKVFNQTLPTGISWHEGSSTSYADPTSFLATTDNFAAEWGTIAYTGPTAKGHWYGEGISNFTNSKNIVAYAYPNPMMGNASKLAVTTIYWDATAIPSVTNVEIHMDSPSGTLFSGGAAAGSAVTGTWVANGTTFYIQDVTGGKPLTSVNTLAVIYSNVQ